MGIMHNEVDKKLNFHEARWKHLTSSRCTATFFCFKFFLLNCGKAWYSLIVFELNLVQF